MPQLLSMSEHKARRLFLNSLITLILLSRVVYSLLGNTVSIVFLSTVVYLLFFSLEMQKRYYVFLRNVEQIPKPLK